MTVKYEELLAQAPAYDTVEDLPENPTLGDIGKVGDVLYARVPGMYKWTVITEENTDLMVQALDILKSMMTNFAENVQEWVKTSPVYPTLDALLASVPADKNIFARLEHEGGDIYVYHDGKWELAVHGKSLEELKELNDAEADIRLRARDLATKDAMFLAPPPSEWGTITELADTNYPTVVDEEGKALPNAAALHLDYLDLQKRVMLTKSVMQAFGANAAPGHQFTEKFLKDQMAKYGINIFERKQTGKGDKLVRGAWLVKIDKLDGIRVTIEDSNPRTLMMRALHFICTRHDPDTDLYINRRLREFANRPGWKNQQTEPSTVQ